MDGSTPGFPVHHQLLELAQERLGTPQSFMSESDLPRGEPRPSAEKRVWFSRPDEGRSPPAAVVPGPS